jgi:hypothetical protein
MMGMWIRGLLVFCGINLTFGLLTDVSLTGAEKFWVRAAAMAACMLAFWPPQKRLDKGKREE